MTDRYVLAADVLAMLMGAAMLVMCVLAYMDGIHDLFIEVFCAAVCFVPFVLRRLRVISLPGMITFLIALAVFLHAYGLISGSYDNVSYFDTITHTLSSAVVAILVFYAMITIQHFGGGRVNFTGRGLAIFTALIALTFSVYWEVMEYSTDMLTGSVTQYSPYDTLTDLVCDSVGTFLASIWSGIYMRGRTIDDAIGELQLGAALRDAAGGEE